MKSPRRRHQLKSLSVESSPLSLVDDSASPSTNPPLSLSRSRRRFRVSGALFDDSASFSISFDASAYLSISSTPPHISRSPHGWIERLEVSSKNRSVVWTDEEAMSISGCLRDRLQPWTGASHGCLGDRVQDWTEATERCFVVSS
ncbi:hypothetical protein F2Q69_00010806 [Brassica cretica]|uniref:Uncharacterized protein n=1 Tax=Brassica cretica TaxID=69181 RepID=A0A8S9QUZ4_BRACR|nr:hypothetical protein F2Q69_00010806 [Brassica cretica]